VPLLTYNAKDFEILAEEIEVRSPQRPAACSDADSIEMKLIRRHGAPVRPERADARGTRQAVSDS
jgi:hypothetical protein